ncbi:MAG: DUF971 domain-containing protein [Gammaproteobacteria bacterium]|nr:DUF971 domain-containing protein [Gammaproteobacteria bacterium]
MTMTEEAPRPTDIRLKQQSRILEISFEDGNTFHLPCEYLRVYSPSAEVQGHGPGQEVLQVGKERVNIESIEPVGTYAVTLKFDDGHDTGIYSWKYLHRLAVNRGRYWRDYLRRLYDAGQGRVPQPYDEWMVDD